MYLNSSPHAGNTETKLTAEHMNTTLDCIIRSVRNRCVLYPSKKCRRDLGDFGMNNIMFIYVQIDKLNFMLLGGRLLSEKAKKTSFPLMSNTVWSARCVVRNVAFF